MTDSIRAPKGVAVGEAPVAARGEPVALAAPARPGLRDLASTTELLLLMLGTDLVFLVLAVQMRFGVFWRAELLLSHDLGYPEIFQYIKLFWIAACFAILAWGARQPVFAVLTALFLYLLLDDARSIHERGGTLLVVLLELRPAVGLRAQDFGELLVSGLAGAVFLVIGAVAYRFSNATARHVTHLTLLGVLLLVFCGVVVDMAAMTIDIRGVNMALDLLEDGGEMVAVSLIAAGALAIVQWYRRVNPATALPAP